MGEHHARHGEALKLDLGPLPQLFIAKLLSCLSGYSFAPTRRVILSLLPPPVSPEHC
jgi:hypothetical protein